VSELVRFRFEITHERLVAVPLATMHRAEAFIKTQLEHGGEIVTDYDWSRLSTVASGEAARPVATVLQALAMGHDIDAVLDMLTPSND
jgi:hypothetical protein